MRIPSWRTCIASLSLTGLAACAKDTTGAPPANQAAFVPTSITFVALPNANNAACAKP